MEKTFHVSFDITLLDNTPGSGECKELFWIKQSIEEQLCPGEDISFFEVEEKEI